MNRFVHALRFPALTGWYDRVISSLLPERQIRERLVDQAALRNEDRVLDASEGVASSQDEVAAALQSYAAALQARDLDGVGAVVTEDLLMFEGTHINRGWADYRDHHLGPEMESFGDGFRYTFEDIETASEGDLAWATFRYTIHVENGDQVYDGGGVATAVLQHSDDGHWRIRQFHSSAERRR